MKLYEDEDFWSGPTMMGSCYGDLNGKVKTKQIGFIRERDVQKPRSRKSAPKGERKTTKGAAKKGTASKRASG